MTSRIDKEIGPRGFDPYNSAERDRESALEWRWVTYSPPALHFEDSILWHGRDGKVRKVTARSPVPVRLLGVEYA